MYYKHYYDNIAKFHFLRGNNMKKERLKDQKGFAGSDALIAVLIIALFAGLIATISYNIYLSNSSIKRMSIATSYIVDVFEYIDKSYYDEVTIEGLKGQYSYLTEYTGDANLIEQDDNTVRLGILEGKTDNDRYTIRIILDQYKPDDNSLDLVKKITMTVKYKLGNKDQEIPMWHIKSRENLDTPNDPEISLIELQEGQKVYPIKKVNNVWKVCDESDNSWYDYTSGKWALVIKTNQELSIGQEISPDNENIYAWIPRYAYDSVNNKIVFLFSNSDKYIENANQENQYNSLKPIEGNYAVLDEFSNEGSPVVGLWTNDTTLGVYQTLNNIYPLSK